MAVLHRQRQTCIGAFPGPSFRENNGFDPGGGNFLKQSAGSVACRVYTRS